MARGKAISVKVPTQRVIEALTQSLAKLELDWTSQEGNEAKFLATRGAWQTELVAFAIANIKKASNFRTNYRSYNGQLNIDFDLTVKENELPAEPTRDFEQLYPHVYTTKKEEISNAIRILGMTDEEFVSTSTFNSISQYL